jgi:hypothetical protein
MNKKRTNSYFFGKREKRKEKKNKRPTDDKRSHQRLHVSHLVEENAMTRPMTRPKGLFGHWEMPHALLKGHGVSHALTHGEHASITLLIKKLMFRNKRTKLPSML